MHQIMVGIATSADALGAAYAERGADHHAEGDEEQDEGSQGDVDKPKKKRARRKRGGDASSDDERAIITKQQAANLRRRRKKLTQAHLDPAALVSLPFLLLILTLS